MINKQLINLSSPASSGGGYTNQEEGLILHLDANDVDSYDGDGTEWVDISSFNINPNTLTEDPPALSTPTPVISYATNDANSYDGTTTLKNLSSGSYNATLGGATYSANDGTSLSFNNSSNVLNTTYSSSGLSAVTWEGWFKLDAVGANEAIGSFSVNGGNVAIFAHSTSTNTPQGLSDYVYVKHADLVGTWIHIAIKFSGWASSYSGYGAGISAKVFINGSATGTVTVTPYGQSSSYNTLFRVMGNVSTYRAGGLFSELRFYESGLSDADVATNYNHGRVKFNQLETANVQLHLDAASFDGSTNTPSTWTALTGSNGTITGATFDSELGNYLNFDGVNDKVDLPAAFETAFDQPAKTLEIWLYATDGFAATGYGMAFSMNQSSLTYGRVIFQYTDSTNLMQVLVGTGAGTYTETTLTSNYWHHLAISIDGASTKLYKDGELVDTGTNNYSSDSSGTPTIGVYNASAAHYWDGGIGQVRAYSSALTSNQIKSNYLFTAPLYPNGYDGSINGATWNAGGYFNFDGSNDYVTLPFNTTLNEFSFYAWVYPDSTSNDYHAILGKWWDGSNRSFFLTGINQQLKVDIAYTDSNADHLFGTLTLPDNAWSFVCVTWKNYEGLTLTVNDTAETFSVNKAIASNTNNWYIGNQDSRIIKTWDGTISKCKMYDKKLSSTEITALYNEGQ